MRKNNAVKKGGKKVIMTRAASAQTREEWQAFGAPWLERIQSDGAAFGHASQRWCERARDRDLAHIPVDQRVLYGWHATNREWVRTDVKQ